MNFISRLFCAIEVRYVPPRLSLWRTLYFNFRMLPFKMAIKMPISIYGRVHFPMLAGSVKINSDGIKRGMIKIGQQDPFDATTGLGFISIAPHTKMVFNGPAQIHTNTAIRILAGELIFGKFAYIGAENKVICNGAHIFLGDYFRCAFQSAIINSNFHSVIDINSGTCQPPIKSIYINEKCWIGNRTTIAGSTKLKSGTIVAAGSYVNKDFTKLEEEHQMIGGRPAKLLKSGLARVYANKVEKEIMTYFDEHPDAQTYHLGFFENEDMTELESEF